MDIKQELEYNDPLLCAKFRQFLFSFLSVVIAYHVGVGLPFGRQWMRRGVVFGFGQRRVFFSIIRFSGLTYELYGVFLIGIWRLGEQFYFFRISI